MTLDRTFQFLGNRKYLHSTSLFDDLLQIRGKGSTRIDMKFHRKTEHQVSYVDELPSSVHEVVAEWSDSNGKIYVIERDKLIQEATPFDESLLTSRFEIDGRVVRIPADTPPFNGIEALVAGFKLLLQTVYADAKRRYVFVRIRLDHYPDDAMEIKYSRDIGDFFQGDVIANGQSIGQIFFGVWE